jgi:hypothetical protein
MGSWGGALLVVLLTWTAPKPTLSWFSSLFFAWRTASLLPVLLTAFSMLVGPDGTLTVLVNAHAPVRPPAAA